MNTCSLSKKNCKRFTELDRLIMFVIFAEKFLEGLMV